MSLSFHKVRNRLQHLFLLLLTWFPILWNDRSTACVPTDWETYQVCLDPCVQPGVRYLLRTWH